jgi:FkbM family methyltransferase
MTTERPAATLLHIGAGAGVTDYLATGAAQIIVVEPDPKAAAELARLAKDMPQLRVLPKAVAASSGEAELRVYNMPGLASLTAPTADLLEIYPGLRVTARHSVTTLSPADLIAEIGEMAAPVRLVLDAPGTEADLLSAWQADGTLAGIDQIELRCAAATAFEGGEPLAALAKRLEAADFDQLSCDNSDPDWPVLHYAFNSLKQQLRQTTETATAAQERVAKLESWLHGQKTAAEAEKAKVATAQKQITELEAALQSQKTTVEAEKAKANDAQKRLAALEAALQDQKAKTEGEKTRADTAQERVGKLENWLNSQKAAVENEKAKVDSAQKRGAELEAALQDHKTTAEGEKAKADAAQERVAALEAALQDQKAKTEGEKTRADTAQERVTGLEAALQSQTAVSESEKTKAKDEKAKLDTAQERIAELEGWLNGQKAAAESEKAKADAAQTRITELEKKLGEVNAALASTKGNLDLTLRLQMMSAHDLSDLQHRFAALSGVKESQDLLLAQLVGRLEEASEYLQGIVAEDMPAALKVVEPATPLETPTETPPKAPRKAKPRSTKPRKGNK